MESSGDGEGAANGVFSERNGVAVLALLFIILSVAVALTPYDVSKDLPDATTNAIWVENYARGTFHIPYDEWSYGMTQSSVVIHDGEYTVVNEKGPGHALLLVPFHVLGVEWLFAPFLSALGLVGTYMLGRRLFCWQVGWASALAVMLNLTVVVMWHRYYWTDTSTMHLVAFAFWLAVEGTLQSDGAEDERPRWCAVTASGAGLAAASGLAFGAAVSTRYPTALLLPVAFLLMAAVRPEHGAEEPSDVPLLARLRSRVPPPLVMVAFAVGLSLVLVPLFIYNTEYFGGPLESGYGATPLAGFDPETGLDTRNTSAWPGSELSGVKLALSNFLLLLPTLISRMPVLVLAPLALVYVRRKGLTAAALSLWVCVNLYTYLSLEWIARYARPDLVPWEPRYFMPALPPLALLGFFGLYHLLGTWSEGGSRRFRADLSRFRTPAMALLVSGVVLFSAVSSVAYLQNPDSYQHAPPPLVSVTVADLQASPEEYAGARVRIERAVVVRTAPGVIFVQDPNATDPPPPLPVRFVEWPPEETPRILPGQYVLVEGLFIKDPLSPDSVSLYMVGVKYGTRDRVAVLQP